MTTKEIQTIGHFLSSYKSDLEFINNFQKNKKHLISNDEYLKKCNGTFYKFLIDYKVIRNLKKDTSPQVLDLTKNWIASAAADNVDDFALELSKDGLTHDKKIMTSLASKILFLNNPYQIIPMDNRAKKSLKHKTNNYTEYLNLIYKFANGKSIKIDECLTFIQPLTDIIEAPFISQLKEIEVIKRNRFIDKLLWIGF